jgi:DNA-binding transcriptional MerR regulator
MPLTITKLARECGLSRTTVLYYESLGLLRPARQSAGNYRMYSDADLARLREVCTYRASGLKLGDIRSILDRPPGEATAVLQRRSSKSRTRSRRCGNISAPSRAARGNQSLKEASNGDEAGIEIMRAAGFSEEQMQRWHREFEKAEPAEHEEFLQFPHIPPAEVKQIRGWSAGKV